MDEGIDVWLGDGLAGDDGWVLMRVRHSSSQWLEVWRRFLGGPA